MLRVSHSNIKHLADNNGKLCLLLVSQLYERKNEYPQEEMCVRF